jgi:hypothetical protein
LFGTIIYNRRTVRHNGIGHEPSILVSSAAATTATATTTITTATPTTATTTTAESAGILAGTRFVDRQRTSSQFLAVKGRDGSLGFRIGGHLDEPESPGPTVNTINHNIGRSDLAEYGELLGQVLVRGLKR